jgi:hypothetical protein
MRTSQWAGASDIRFANLELDPSPSTIRWGSPHLVLLGEFSYGFAVTHELILQNSGNVVAAPEFPSLIREGQAVEVTTSGSISGLFFFSSSSSVSSCTGGERVTAV